MRRYSHGSSSVGVRSPRAPLTCTRTIITTSIDSYSNNANSTAISVPPITTDFTASATKLTATTGPTPRRYMASGADIGCSVSVEDETDIGSIRNIGIIAHVDAGKTTTTERMLFYSGKIRNLGNVDSGTTVTDFLEEERKRGITIQSACTTLDWAKHRINLIDTPGHVDFTVEVERSVRVLDGAVAILDAVAGVQAQTETVWKQAERHGVAMLVFVNKMDRADASSDSCLKSIQQKLPGAKPFLLQVAQVNASDGAFQVVDLRNLNQITWKDHQGEEMEVKGVAEWTKTKDPKLKQEAYDKRLHLLETLADLDDDFCDIFLESEEGGGNGTISEKQIDQAIRRITIGLRGIPMVCGTSLRNRGVQPLLDAICKYLPSPVDVAPKRLEEVYEFNDRPHDTELANKGNSGALYALVFKVTHDQHRGPLLFVRVYQGCLRVGATVECVSPIEKKVMGTERVLRILQLHGDEMNEVRELRTGDIAALIGLKHVRTGYTLTLPEKGRKGKRARWIPHTHFLPPVFHCSIECDSATDHNNLDRALEQMMLEDPSLDVEEDKETGQTLLKGMGELHLEVVHHRLETEFNIGARLGKMRVAYRETLTSEVSHSTTLAHSLRQGFSEASISVKLIPDTEGSEAKSGPDASSGDRDEHEDPQKVSLVISDTAEASLVRKLGQTTAKIFLNEIKDGIRNALSCGPLLGYPVLNLKVSVTAIDASATTQPVTCNAAASKCVSEAIHSAEAAILEPIVKVLIRVPNEYMGSVLSDLSSSRRGQVSEVVQLDQVGTSVSLITAEVPLAAMIGYATALRASTQGNGTFEMAFLEYRFVGQELQKKLLDDPYSF